MLIKEPQARRARQGTSPWLTFLGVPEIVIISKCWCEKRNGTPQRNSQQVWKSFLGPATNHPFSSRIPWVRTNSWVVPIIFHYQMPFSNTPQKDAEKWNFPWKIVANCSLFHLFGYILTVTSTHVPLQWLFHQRINALHALRAHFWLTCHTLPATQVDKRPRHQGFAEAGRFNRRFGWEVDRSGAPQHVLPVLCTQLT